MRISEMCGVEVFRQEIPTMPRSLHGTRVPILRVSHSQDIFHTSGKAFNIESEIL